jgi:Zn-dependent protease with chaperone function
MLLLSVLAFLATPVFNAIGRHYEHEADRYGIEVIHGIVPNANQVAAHYFEKSGEINLNEANPSEWVKIWFYDHPTRPERVHFVATYDPWTNGEKGKYVP